MSSIAKTNISLSKKDLTKSRIPPVGSRNVVFHHKATVGQLTINLLALTLPSAEMPTVVQATPDELSSARLSINKKNLNLVSSSKGDLIQGLDYIVVDSSTISLIGPYETIGTESEEIFVGTINNAPISDLVVASARTVSRSYTLAVGQRTLNLAQEFQVNLFPSENIGIVKIFVNGILAYRNTGNSSTVLDKDYYEVDSGNGFGTTVVFNVAPVSVAHDIVVDFGVQAITDFNAIGTIESLGGSIKKIADDLAVVAGTQASDYYSASPSEVERRTFGDNILGILELYTQQIENQSSDIDQTASFASATITGVLTSSNGSGLYSYNNTTGIYTALKDIKVDLSASMRTAAGSTITPYIYINSTLVAASISAAIAGSYGHVSMSRVLTTGSTWYFANASANNSNAQIISVVATNYSSEKIKNLI